MQEGWMDGRVSSTQPDIPEPGIGATWQFFFFWIANLFTLQRIVWNFVSISIVEHEVGKIWLEASFFSQKPVLIRSGHMQTELHKKVNFSPCWTLLVRLIIFDKFIIVLGDLGNGAAT